MPPLRRLHRVRRELSQATAKGEVQKPCQHDKRRADNGLNLERAALCRAEKAAAGGRLGK
jgi:hypothetical protein